MYEQFYGFRGNPFQLSPDPHYFYESSTHRRAMAYLEYGLHQGEGFIAITGEVGAGKTTLVRNLLARLHAKNIVSAQIVNTGVDADGIVKAVVAAFGIPVEGTDKSEQLARLEEFLQKCDRSGRRALLMVDEAQNLSPRALEELRMLSNYQSGDRPLLQTFLLGQPEFRRTLFRADLEQLRQRVIATYHLHAMDEEETKSYVEHRLQVAGWDGDPQFSKAAGVAIHRHTGGIPRRINNLCNRLLLMSYLDGLHAIDERHVAAVVREMQHEARPDAGGADDGERDLDADAGKTQAGDSAGSVHPEPPSLTNRMARLRYSSGPRT